MNNLFNFIYLNKNKNNSNFINSAFKIGEIYGLQGKDIAIILYINFTKNFIVELENISKKDDIIINNYKEEFNLNKQEIIVLDYIISQNKKVKEKEKDDSQNKSIGINKAKNNLDNNEDRKEQISTVEEQSDNNNNTIFKNK